MNVPEHRYSRQRLEPLAPPSDLTATEPELMFKGPKRNELCLKEDGCPLFSALPGSKPRVNEVWVKLDCINLTGVRLDKHSGIFKKKFSGFFATGIIYSLGDEVSNWRIGESVIVAAEGMPALYVSCPCYRLFPIANFQSWAHEEIVTLMTTIIPAYYALSHIARVAAGETVLIDAEAGAPALAVYTVGNWLGARPLQYSVNETRLLVLETKDGESAIDTRQSDIAELVIAENKTSKVRVWVHAATANYPIAVDGILACCIHEIVLSHEVRTSQLLPSLVGSSFSHVNALTLAFTSPGLFMQLLAEAGEFLNTGKKNSTALQLLTPDEAWKFLSSNSNFDAKRIPILVMKDKE
ncbi:hypothetical protein METHB2_160012 [Candidatus Methylobacter favarea]|uniref:Enoyl reductase (ER) domain-containing protein n=1 Tax=Candidatus Methylobacter favarea TaxID=2707345 RepID=A0A8S0WZ38_9GAMM|nr:hypothetical protein [Candidatus Methylobacter favarea]CAA9889945.1 hypothetical protein METHB2_160012 [Candidatus Methylobacter favarea]